MTNLARVVAPVAIFVALASGALVQAEQDPTPEGVAAVRADAEQGVGNAQNLLGFMYEDGRGVPRNYVQAHMWYSLAVSRVPAALRELAVKNRDEITDKMTSNQLAEARRLAREWSDPAPATAVATESQSARVTLRVAVFDDGMAAATRSALIGREAQVFLEEQQGREIWNIGRVVREERGGSIREFGPLEVDRRHVLVFTHVRRDGSAIEIPIQLTSELCPTGCDRDTLHIDVFSESVEVWGSPLRATGDTELEFRR